MHTSEFLSRADAEGNRSEGNGGQDTQKPPITCCLDEARSAGSRPEASSSHTNQAFASTPESTRQPGPPRAVVSRMPYLAPAPCPPPRCRPACCASCARSCAACCPRRSRCDRRDPWPATQAAVAPWRGAQGERMPRARCLSPRARARRRASARAALVHRRRSFLLHARTLVPQRSPQLGRDVRGVEATRESLRGGFTGAAVPAAPRGAPAAARRGAARWLAKRKWRASQPDRWRGLPRVASRPAPLYALFEEVAAAASSRAATQHSARACGCEAYG